MPGPSLFRCGIGYRLGGSGAQAVVSLADKVPTVADVLNETDVEHVISVGGTASNQLKMATGFEEFLADDVLGIVERTDDDVAVQPYTSETTGTPKGVLLTHHNLAWTTRANAAIAPGGFQPSDRFIGTLPLFHIYGMSVVMNGTMYSGGTYYPVTEWDASLVMNQLKDEEITIMFGVPAMFNDMINQPDADEYEFDSLRFINSGGSSLPLKVLERFEELYDVQLNEGYGLTETSPVMHANRPDARRKGSIGQPLEGIDAKIINNDFETVPRVEEGPIDEDEAALNEITGELVVSGPNVMKGYYGLPEANEEAFTEENGKRWFHTGDIGYWDEDDFFSVVERKTHMIVTGSYNVYPREVEKLLFEHEDVTVDVPDKRRGETIKALIVPTPDAEATPEEIKQYCLNNLAEYIADAAVTPSRGRVRQGTPSDDHR